MKDSDVLRISWKKYKDQTGKKARNLELRIECFESFERLWESVTEET